jgi:DNA-binding NtrC family response regulator
MRAHPVAGWSRSTSLIGQSAVTARLRADIARVARFASNVLISGPSGTGKELVARQIHAGSPRAARPFIPVDCASMTGELMSSQLFGHIAGAFTGANCDALGCFRAANRGTLFLDEIGELEHPLQAKLLRVLQEKVVTPVGSHRGERVDVRVVAATNRDLRAEVLEGRFREDLYYRLDVVHLRTTALRDRPSDIAALAQAFLGELTDEGLPRRTLTPDANAVLVSFHWPGNVRQLRNVLEQAVIDSQSPAVSAALLRQIVSRSFAALEAPQEREPPPISAPLPSQSSTLSEASQPCESEWLTLERIERDQIVRTLEHTFYNRSAAARLLGVTRQSLLRKLKRHGIEIPDGRLL